MSVLSEIFARLKKCPECGQHNIHGGSHCSFCGARIKNRNPVLRFFITIAAVGVVLLVVWWKLKR